MTTTFPTRDDFNGLHPDFLITRADVALIADVEPATVQGWTQDEKLQFPPTVRQGPRHRVFHRIGEVLEWLCDTGRIVCDETENLLTQDQAAAHIGVVAGTVKQWRKRRLFPQPDRIIDRRPYWLPATLDAWEGRPKRGGNNRAPRQFTDPGPPSEAQQRALQKVNA